jgi:hypothetical protein
MKRLATMLALTVLALSAHAHGGEDHGDEAAPPAVVAEAGPRAIAASEDFEFVALPQAGQLLIYLDRFATNEPVANAEVEIESGAFKAIATVIGPGVYAVAGDAFKAPGRHPLTVTIQTDAKSGGVSDLLSATLEIAPPAASVAPATGRWANGASLGAAALAVLALGATIAIARRRREGRERREGRNAIRTEQTP